MIEIIVTIGPKSIQREVLEGLKLAGATSFRINLSHSNLESLDEYFSAIKAVDVVPSVDTQGAQLRIEALPDSRNFLTGSKLRLLFVSAGNKSLYHDDNKMDYSDMPRIILNHPEASLQMEVGDKLKIDFSGLVVKLISYERDSGWLAEVISGGSAIINRAVDIQSKSVELSPLTAFDLRAIDFAISNGCKRVYASFVSSLEDVQFIRSKIGPNIELVSKIESAKGVANALDIIDASDAVLIDRGDLSREISIPSVPMAVRSILELANSYSCPVYVATNILDSMMTSQFHRVPKFLIFIPSLIPVQRACFGCRSCNRGKSSGINRSSRVP